MEGWKGLSQAFITRSTSSILGNMAPAASSPIPNLLAHSLPLQRLLRPKWCICIKIIRGGVCPAPKGTEGRSPQRQSPQMHLTVKLLPSRKGCGGSSLHRCHTWGKIQSGKARKVLPLCEGLLTQTTPVSTSASSSSLGCWLGGDKSLVF